MSVLSVPNGLDALGYKKDQLDQLVKLALPQERILKLTPGGYTSD